MTDVFIDASIKRDRPSVMLDQNKVQIDYFPSDNQIEQVNYRSQASTDENFLCLFGMKHKLCAICRKNI